MKVIKEKEQSLLISVFGLRDKYYLTLSGLIFFDLDNPGAPLPEKELWSSVKKELGKGGILDEGRPKGRGEVLVYGGCYAPGGRTITGGRVRFRVGNLEKALYVVGHRTSHTVLDKVGHLSRPEPFSQMAVSWENAYGGPDFKENPLGRGAPRANGKLPPVYRLPNVEYPDDPVSNSGRLHQPASFRPYPVQWPQRSKKAGTYDEKWQKTRWPGYPDDMDPSIFNTAPEDQWIKEYFLGNETIEIDGMHPDNQAVRSRLPGLRLRFFITKNDHGSKGDGEGIFQEVHSRLDTVWLFPSIMRGLVLFRGDVETVDDEMSDVRHILLAAEDIDEQPLSLEHYLEERNRRLNRSVDIDQAAIDKAKEKIASVLNLLAGIPKQIKERQDRAFGRAPKGKSSPAEKIQKAQARLAGAGKVLDRTEQMIAAAMARHGHLVSLDDSFIQKTRSKIAAAAQKLPQVQANIEAQLAKADEAAKNIDAALQEQAAKAKLAGGGEAEGIDIDPEVERLIYGTPERRWKKSGFEFVLQAQKNLLREQETLTALNSLGLTLKTVRKSFLGLNPEERKVDSWSWGLADKPVDNVPAEETRIPAGLVIPSFIWADLAAFRIRPKKSLDDFSRDTLIQGPRPGTMILGAGGDKPFVLVNDELEALLIMQEAGDICGAAAMRKPDDELADDLAESLQAAPVILKVFPADPGLGEDDEMENWRGVFPQAELIRLPAGARPSQAKREGVDLEDWIRRALPLAVVQTLPPAPKKFTAEDIKPGMAVPLPDISGLRQAFKDEGKSRAAARKAEAEKIKAEAMAKVHDQLRKADMDPDEVLAKSRKAFPKDPFDVSAAVAAIEQRKAALKKMGALTPQVEQKLGGAQAEISAFAAKSAERYKAGLAKLAAAKEKLADPVPAWAKELMAQRGLDPEGGHRLTREKVLERYEQGLDFDKQDLSGLDLSETKLPGINLSRAICRGTNFQGANLDGAVLTRAICQVADFSGASLKKGLLAQGILMKANFSQADLSGADLTKALCKEADFSGALFDGTVLKNCLLDKARLTGAKMTGALAGRCLFKKTELGGADFKGANLVKAIFINTDLSGLDFSGCRAGSAVFMGVFGREADFSGADLTKSRFIKKTCLPKVNFSGAIMNRACLMDSEFSQGRFSKVRLGKGFVQDCKMDGADFYLAMAPGARLTKTDFTGAKMKGLNLMQGSLRKARLVDADLSHANLYGVDLYKAVIGNTNFRRANMKKNPLEKYGDALR